MPNVITIHSFKYGTGKSNVAANMAVMLANEGWRIGLIEANLEAPSIATIFGLQSEGRQNDQRYYLNDFLLNRCKLNEVVTDLSSRLSARNGKLLAVLASDQLSDIAHIRQSGVQPELIKDAISTLQLEASLDTIIVETPVGINEDTLSLIGMATALGFVMKLDHQEYQGIAAALELARKLDVEHIAVMVNDVSPHFNTDQVKQEVETTYNAPAYILPHSDEMLIMGGKGLFTLQYPDHPYTLALKEATATLLE